MFHLGRRTALTGPLEAVFAARAAMAGTPAPSSDSVIVVRSAHPFDETIAPMAGIGLQTGEEARGQMVSPVAAPARQVTPADLLIMTTMAFLTVVDLFAAQAILPMLREAYDVSPGAVALAVNATTLGMLIGGLGLALVSHRIERRRGIILALGLLAIPTLLLGLLPPLPVFAVLRVLRS